MSRGVGELVPLPTQTHRNLGYLHGHRGRVGI